jgi:hypothetical protein
MTKIIGFSGKKQSGKSTSVMALYAVTLADQGIYAKVNDRGKLVVMAALGEEGKESFEESVLEVGDPTVKVYEFLYEFVWPYVKEYSFAHPLKMFCIHVLGLERKQVFGSDDDKNTLTRYRWEDMPGVVSPSFEDKWGGTACDWNLIQHTEGVMTAREVLQFFGTNVCRRMYDKVWTETLLERRIPMEEPELALVSDIRFPDEVEAVQKAGGKVIRYTRAPFADSDEHSSETALDDYEGFDKIIDNKDMTIPEQIKSIKETLLEWEYISE